MLEQLLYMLFRGMVIGLVVSAPMGPVGIFCIQRTLDKGRMSGFYTGVGAAVSDLIYCLLTGFCVSFIEEFINTNRPIIQLLGSLVLIAFGIWLIKKKPSGSVRADAAADAPSKEGDILKGFALTFSNPLILFLIIGLFAQFNFVIEDMKFYHYVLGFIGIFSGALGWWWFVTYFVDKLRGHFNVRTMKLINTCVGAIILVFAALGIFGSVSSFAARAPHPQASEVSLVAGFRVSDTAMKGWTADFVDTAGEGFRINVKPIHQTDAFGDSNRDVLAVEVCDVVSGEVIASAEISGGIDPYRGKNAWCVSRSGDFWRVLAGNREYVDVLNFKYSMGIPTEPSVCCAAGGGIEVSQLYLDVEPEAAAPEMYDVAELLASHEGGQSAPCGVYALFDYEHDDSYAVLGGDYRVALTPVGEDGDMSLVYLSGARTLAGRWKPGMRKALLKITPFTNIYDVEWVDAEGDVMRHDVQAEFDPLSQTLTVKFPYQSSMMRFRKER